MERNQSVNLNYLLRGFHATRPDPMVEKCRRIYKYVWLERWVKLKEEFRLHFHKNPLLEIRMSQYTSVTPLSLACRYGDSDFVKALIGMPQCRFMDSRFIHESLLECVRHGHWDCFRDLVEIVFKQNVLKETERGEEFIASIRSQNFDDVVTFFGTELEILSLVGDKRVDLLNILIVYGYPPSCIEVLIQYGIDINERDSSGLTPLICAVLAENIECLLFLLRSGVDILELTFKALEGDPCNALMCSACFNDTKILRTFIKHVWQSNSNVNKGDVNHKTHNLGWTALSFAVHYGNFGSASLLVTLGSDICINDNFNKNLLTLAIGSGNWECVKFLSERIPGCLWTSTINGDFWNHEAWFSQRRILLECFLRLVNCLAVDVNALHDGSSHVLGVIAMRGCVDIVEWLLDQGAQIDSKDEFGHTALMLACAFDHKSVVELLVKRGADVNICDESGKYAICFAVDYKCKKSISVLMRDNVMKITNVESLLFRAENNKEIVQCLLDNGVDINSVNSDGRTTLIVGCKKENYDSVVELLVKKGADVNIQDRFGHSAIWYAVKCRSLNKVKTLFSGKTKVNITNGNKPLIHLANECVGIVECLLHHGADIDAKDSDGRSALIVACEKKYNRVVELLVRRGADVNILDRKEKTAICYAVNTANIKNVRALSIAKSPLKLQGKTHFSLVFIALKNVEILECLLDHGVDININKDNNGRTALIMACKKNYVSTVELLVKRGADVNIQDKFGQSALWYTMNCRPVSAQCVKVLLHGHADLRIKGYEHKSLLSFVTKKSKNIERKKTLVEIIDEFFSSGSLVWNGYLRPLHKQEITNKSVHSIWWLKHPLQYYVFEWNFVSHSRLASVAFHVVSQGVCPGRIRTKNGEISPLLAALRGNDVPLVRYFLANLYFVSDDYRTLTLSNRFRSCMSEGLSSLYHRFTSQPLSLQTWSFITISEAISLSGPPCLRPRRVLSLQIPSNMKNALSFQTKLSMTCPGKMTEFEPSLLPPFGPRWENEPLRCPQTCRFCKFSMTKDVQFEE